MDLTPGERAMLSQLRDLYASTSKREYPLATITGQWPAIHFETYKSVLQGLVGKRLVEATNRGKAVRITDSGMLAMGIVDVAETKTIDLRVLAKSRSPEPKSATPTPPASPRRDPYKQAIHTPQLGFAGRVSLIAIAACAVALLWWFLWPG